MGAMVNLNSLSQLLGAIGAVLSFVLVVWDSIKNRIELFNLSKRSRLQRHLLSYCNIYSLFAETKKQVRNIMTLIVPTNVLKAYSLWSVSKLFLLYLLWISFVSIEKRVLDFYYGLLVVVVYFSWLIFLFWGFVFSQFSIIKKKIPQNLNFDGLKIAGGSSYLIYVFSAFGFVGTFFAYYVAKLQVVQWSGELLFLVSCGITALTIILFRRSLLVNTWNDKLKTSLMLIAMMLSLLSQFDISLSSVSDTVKIWIFIVFAVEFFVIGYITSKIESNLTSLLWKLKVKENDISTPWIKVFTRDGTVIDGVLLDFLDEDYLILKNGYCYHAISWKEINTKEITVCGDILYRNS
ncbi:hypothetical protein [Thermococcus sp. 21S7]|uniref:hypothetical protein n=1 Tax=Thermococcus sp. 21S7 TaxID=1638221 RepID=UPI00143CBDC7|nr:hypothetical protein [Thermococcus sp. 21S7]NJE60644.1 hypothetical protein [Thermococcus sp. 21S7]